MKKLLLSLIVCLFSAPLFADSIPGIGDQVAATLADHATFSLEFRKGSKNLVLSDNVIEVGHLKSDYIFSFDLGLNGATFPATGQSGLEFTTGGRLNLNALVKNWVTLKPEWTFLQHFEYYPRGFYDWTERKWHLSFNVGYGFGPSTGATGAN